MLKRSRGNIVISSGNKISKKISQWFKSYNLENTIGLPQRRKECDAMIRKQFTVNSQYGFHLRPAQVLVEKMTPFESEITVKKSDGTSADAKSLLGLMSLGLAEGQTVEVEISGVDEAKAMETVEELFRTNYGE